MTSIIRLQALSGVFDETPHCYLLHVDEFRFLLDCGWDEKFNMHFARDLKKHIPQVDAVLLSYPDYYHLGALPYAVGKLGLNCPIYATIPVYKMGQMFMYDLFQSRHNTEEFELFTLDDVDAAFDKIIQLKYNQSVSLKGKGHGLTITPLLAGHMIGGTIWRIVKDGEEDIVYAVDYNHKKERHLNGCVLETLSRPSLLITDSLNANHNQSRRRQRDEQLMTNILQTLRNGGNVLVAVDTAGRVLELAHMVDQLWRNQDSGLLAYSLALLNNVSYNVVEFAKSQVEWMSDKIMRSFEGARSNPFQFKHLQLCHSMAELSKVPDPKVVLASTPDMESGFSRELFIQWCTNSKNSIILTGRTCPGTLARYLIENPGTRTVTLEVRKRVRLEGSELEEYLKKGKEKDSDGSRMKGDKVEIVIDSSDESEDDVEVENRPTAAGKAKHDLMMKSEGKSRGGFFKQVKKSYPMFPVKEEKLKWDDYGEIIRTEDFMIAEFNAAEEGTKDKEETTIEEMQDICEVPTKCIKSHQMLDINCSVTFIDFEGRSDGESLKKIISQIKPRRLILVRGSPDATMSLAAYCQSSVQGKIFTPQLHEIIDATTESHIYQVRLKDSLVSSLMLARAKDAELAWVDGEIVMKADDTKADIRPSFTNLDDEPMAEDPEEDDEDDDDVMDVEGGREIGLKKKSKMKGKDFIPTLEPLPMWQVEGHATVFVNELKLSDFKQVLMRAGIFAEFSAGVLYCNNGMIAVRRNEAGRINLEGCLCDDYYKIRELLYEQYAII